VLIIDGTFGQLASALLTLQLADLGGSQSYMVLLVCPTLVEACINANGQGSTIRDILATGGLAILSPYEPEWAQLIEKEISLKGKNVVCLFFLHKLALVKLKLSLGLRLGFI
jgi:hypothetical protein